VADRIDRSERLLNLVVALLGTRRAMSRAQIRETVPGYSSAASDSAFERMFERDKDELRSMGVPIETVHDESGDVLGYRVEQSRFGYVDVHFSGAEFQMLGIAAQAWEQAALGPQARAGLLKLRPMADGAEYSAESDVVFSAHLTASESALLPVMKAIREHVQVRFPYTSAGSAEAAERSVEPWGVVCRSGRWYLLGFDRDRSAPRMFRLSRITGACVIVPDPCISPRPPSERLTALLDEMLLTFADAAELMTAHLVVRRPPGAELMRRAVRVDDLGDGSDAVWLTDTQPTIVSAVVRSLPHVEVVEPEQLVGSIRAHLEAIALSHGGTE
jgi:proteasome accessory factor B